MKKPSNAGRVAATAPRGAFSPHPIAAACAVLLFAVGSVNAQQVDAAKAEADAKAKAAAEAKAKAQEEQKKSTDLGSVTVTGIRRGIEEAISVKKNSDSIVEAVSAEDIGKLPDTSIAESIARLPGLAAQRVAGRAQVISVRGLSPDFATTLLNGREQVSTGDNRGVEFDQYPSELLSGVTVYKTPDAGLIGQGLSGTLDLQTVRPLAFNKRTVAFNVRGERNSLGSGVDQSANGNRVSATYIDQFANRTLGLALGYAHLDSPILAQEYGNYGWSKDGRPTLPAGTSNTNGLKSYARSGKNTRDGLIGVLEWKPTENWTSVLDGYYSKFKRVETARGIETNLGDYNGGNSPGLTYTSTTIDNGILVGGTANNVYPLVRGLYNEREDKLAAIAWNNKYRFSNWTLMGDASYSRANRKELNLETNSQYVSAAGTPVLDSVNFNLNTGGFPTAQYGLNYADPDRIRVGSSIYGAGYGKVPMVKDELKSFRLQATIPLDALAPDLLSDLDVGINYAQRTKDKKQPEASLTAPGTSTVSSDLRYANADLGFMNSSPALTWDVPALLARYYNPFVPTDNASYLVQKAWEVREKITTGYIKTGIDSHIGTISLRGNVGVQLQHTDQSSSSNFWDNTAPDGSKLKPVNDGKAYNDVLPSMNLAFGLPYDQTVRFAAAKQIARPRLDQLKSALEFEVDTTTFVPKANGGNSRLDPWRANAFDLSYEKYFANKGYVAVAGFYKKLKTYIFDQTEVVDLSKFSAGTTAATPFGKYSHPLNGQGGSLKGVELSASVPFSLLTPVLDGFGVQASYSYNKSKITIDNTNLGSGISLPGLSKNVSNLTAYYEKYGFSTRISRRERSDFIGEITGFGADRELRFTKGESVVDFQVGYEFVEGSFKGLGLLLQVNNLTNSAYQTFQVTPSQPAEYQKYGRTLLLGVNYKL